MNTTNQNNQNENLNKFAINLCERAREGKLDPVIGRDDEIRRVLQILSRRTKNNPILIGEPGVGKTAIAEGLAHRIMRGDVPENLKKKRLEELKEKEAEIKALQKQRFGPGGDMDKKSAELIKPVQDRIYAAIERVAHEKNFAFVFDKAASSTVLFANKKYDISDDVLELLGYKPGAANDMSVPADKNQHQRASNPEMRQQDPNTASPLGRMR